MSTVAVPFTLHFPEGYDARMEHETPSRGYLSNVVVRADGGARYELFFVDPVRLQQELADNARSGQPFFAEPNLIVLPRVTTDTIREAVTGLLKEGYFERVKPLEAE
jgi:hypothetical protein